MSTSTFSTTPSSASLSSSTRSVDLEERRLVVRIADDADDDPVEDPRRARDHVDVPVRDGVVRAGVDRGDHLLEQRKPCGPVLARGPFAQPGTSGGGSRPDVSQTSTPSGRRSRREARREALPVEVVGRVAEDQVVRPPVARDRAHGVLAEHGALQAELVEVGVDRAAGVAIRLDERRRRRPAGERFEPHCARAREEVEHVRVVDGPDQVERVLADAVRGRPGVAALRARRSADRGACRR